MHVHDTLLPSPGHPGCGVLPPGYCRTLRHLDVARSYNNLGEVQHTLGDLEKAKEYHERAIAIRLEKLGPDHLDVAMCHNNLGNVHRDLGDLEQAKECYERALTIRLKKLDPDHLDVLAVQHKLTQLQQMMESMSRKKRVHHTRSVRCTIL